MLDFLLDGFSFRRNAAVLSLTELAALGPVREPERSQWSRLTRHLLERFFNHETASPDGDAKTRLVQIAFAAGLPGFVVVLYLDPIYHRPTPPPYWLQVNHHLFFVLYSFVAMGVALVFQWDLFFPDLLDIQILKTLPVKDRNVFLARVAAIAILVAAFLFDSNFLAPTIMHITLNPPHPGWFTLVHIVSVSASGLFSAAFMLALQGSMLAILGERVFRSLSLLLQGLLIALLVILMLLLPTWSALLPAFLHSGSVYVLCFPPFWFLGMYQRLLDGPGTLPIFTTLARIGVIATSAAMSLTVLTYPIAYMRRMRQVIEGPGKHTGRWRRVNPLIRWLRTIFDRAVLRRPLRRAIHHFVSQTLTRVPRYRIYLVLYGGVGLSVVVSSILNFTVADQRIRIDVSPEGVPAAIAIVAFWTIAGLRMAFVSSGNRNGSWVFHVLLGRPPAMSATMELSYAAQVWVISCSAVLTFGALFLLHAVAPLTGGTAVAAAAQSTAAVGLCILLTDIFFLHVTRIAFSGEKPRESHNLGFTVLKYIVLFPIVVGTSVSIGRWMKDSALHVCFAAVAIGAAHLTLRLIHRAVVQDYSDCPALEGDEEEFLIRLGLRY